MIVVEFIDLPTVDLTIKVLSRITVDSPTNPIKTGWVVESIAPSFTTTKTTEELFKKFFVSKLRKLLCDSILSLQDKDIPEHLFDLFKETEVKLIKCEVAQTKDPDSYLKEII